MKIKNIILIVITTLFVFATSANAKNIENYTFTFKDINGKNITIDTFTQGLHFKGVKNKIVLLDFFGNMCPPCLMEMPELVELQKEFKNNLKIIAFQVQTRITDKNLKTFVKNHKLNYTVINSSNAKVFNFIHYISIKASWKGMIPFAILFDKKGNATREYIGLRSKKEFQEDIKRLLDK